MSSPFGSARPDPTQPSRSAPSLSIDTPPPPDSPSPLPRRSWRDRLRIALAIIWLLALLGYYGHGFVSLFMLAQQEGLSALDGTAWAHAFWFDQLLTLPTQQPLLSVLLFFGVLGLTIAGDWALFITLQTWFTARRPRRPTQLPLPLPPEIADQPIAGMKNEQFMTILRDVIHQEIRLFAESQEWQFRVNLGLAIIGLGLGIVSVLPTFIFIGQAASATR